MNDETRWINAPIVFLTIPIPVCHHCGGTDFMRIRTETAGDGSFSRKLICRNCSRKTLAVYELPESGKATLPGEYS